MRGYLCGLGMAGVISLALTACTPPEKMARSAERVAPTPAEMMAAWHEIAQADLKDMDVRTASAIARHLSQSGDGGLDPIIDVLASPDAEDKAKVLAVISLTPLLTPEMLPRLMAITEKDKDVTSRCCAINLVGLYTAPEAEARLLALLKSPIHRVKAEATIMLLMRGHEAGLDGIQAIWDHPETTGKHRTQITLQLPEKDYKRFERLFLEAVVNPEIEAPARQRAAEILGRNGGEAAAKALKQCAEKDAAEGVRAIATAGVEAIAARESASGGASTPPVGATP